MYKYADCVLSMETNPGKCITEPLRQNSYFFQVKGRLPANHLDNIHEQKQSSLTFPSRLSLLAVIYKYGCTSKWPGTSF